MSFRPRFMATLVAPIPQRDPDYACQLVLDHFPEAPCLPNLTSSMRMYLEGMPCMYVNSERKKICFDFSPAREGELLEFYEHILADDVDHFAVSEQLAIGPFAMLRRLQQNPPASLQVVHIHVPGPISLAMSAEDDKGTPAFYNETARDVVVKTLAMKARWLERLVRQTLPGVTTLVEIGEPALVVHTSAVGSGSRDDLISAMDEVLAAVEGIAGIHCCANVDWPILFETRTDFINFDAYEYAGLVALYGDELKRFLARGGTLAWGCVPVFDEKLAAETVDSLVERLERGMQLMVDKGIDRQQLAAASWVTPCCSTSSMSLPLSERALAYAGEIARRMRAKYFDLEPAASRP